MKKIRKKKRTCTIIPAAKMTCSFTMDDGSTVYRQVASFDSTPAHFRDASIPQQSPEAVMSLCIEEVHKKLQVTGADTLVDLVNTVVQDMDIVPPFTYSQIAERMAQDPRFAHHKLMFFSLAGDDPAKLMAEKLVG